jgi:hypothetical protein
MIDDECLCVRAAGTVIGIDFVMINTHMNTQIQVIIVIIMIMIVDHRIVTTSDIYKYGVSKI